MDRGKGNLIIACAAFVLVVLAVGIILLRPSGAQVIVRCDGQIIGEYPIGKDRIERIECEAGFNEMEISEGKVRVVEADCPGHDCVDQGWISASGQAIVCLPHRLSISVEGGFSGEMDAVSR